MKTRDIVIGVVVLAVLITGVLLVRRARNKSANPLPTPSFSERVNQAFPNLNIPDGVERAELTDVSGGDGIGVATRTEIVANLPAGQTYKAYLENAQGKTVLLGTLYLTKSGLMITYNSAKFPGYDKVIVSSGTQHILEGSF